MKHHGAVRGFTLVEIMIVVAIIALLAAIAIPNVLRGRATANETAAIGNIRSLISSLEMYRSVYQAYPDAVASWGTELYNFTPAFGPPSFNNAILTSWKVQGFLYNYTPNGTSNVQQYNVLATPAILGSTGTRTFWGNESGQVFHCTGGNTVNTPSANAVTIDQVPKGC